MNFLTPDIVVEPFSPEFLSDKVLKQLMSKRVYFDVKVDQNCKFDLKENIPLENILYTNGKAADYFVLILEGRVKVVIGKEKHTYESGPFQCFGISALKLTVGEKERVTKSTSLGRMSFTDSMYTFFNDLPLFSRVLLCFTLKCV